MAVQSETTRITNEEDMCKRFRKLVLPKIQIIDIPHYFEHKNLSGILQNGQKRYCNTLLKSKPHKNTETQTDYRESETQTEPWEPPYKIIPGHNPGILTLAHLTWKHGLPAGVHEIHVINWMQIKKAWETILPSMDTPTNIKLRNSIIIMLEIDEWAFRESEIQFIMDLRLNLMRNLLQSDESQYRKKVKNRFNRLQNKLRQHRDNQVNTIRHNLKRNLRKLYRKHSNNQQFRKFDVIERHTCLESNLYESQIHRYNKHSQSRHEKLELLNENYIEQEKEDTLFNWLPTIEEPKVIKRKPKSIDICIRETRWTEEKLKQLYFDLKAIRMNVKSVDVIPTLIKRDYNQLALSVTPRISSIQNSKQKREKSAIFIQKLVKGRATQCLMYEGRDRYKELIEELHSTQTPEQLDEQKDHEKIRMIELQNDLSIQENRLCEILNSLEGKTIYRILDFLSKELMRLEDERRAHAFVLLAERERYMREAAEAGKRQLERNLRREFDEMFKQIVKVNQDSIEAYLEDIIRESVDWMSDKTAKEQVLHFYDEDNTSKHTLEKQDCIDKLSEKKLVTDMIYNFVLPEVEKHNMKRNTCDRQQNYMRNAYISIYEKILNLSSIKSLQVTEQKEQDMEVEKMEFLSHKIKEKKQI